MPEGDVIGAVTQYTVKPKDTLYDIARRFDIGIVGMLTANPGIDPWVPKPGTLLTIPAAHVLPPAALRRGIVINLSALRLFYFSDSHTVITFPVGIGMEGWLTPTGMATVIKKRKDPVWIPPESIRMESPDLPEAVPAGPENPLGEYALNLDWPNYVIHGTNRPFGIGKRSSHGCIRLYPEDIAALFDMVDEGAPVTIIDMPFALGWWKNRLFLEVMPSQQQSDEIAEYRLPTLADLPEVYYAVRQAAGDQAKIDWHAVREAVLWRTGIPVAVAVAVKE
jgi:L,D-transpeptidase ErfK/SrfK